MSDARFSEISTVDAIIECTIEAQHPITRDQTIERRKLCVTFVKENDT